MTDLPIYTEDYIGLKTLDSQGRLISQQAPDAYHMDWLTREDLFVKYLEPYLS